MEDERRATFWYCVALTELVVICILVTAFAAMVSGYEDKKKFGTREVRIVEKQQTQSADVAGKDEG